MRGKISDQDLTDYALNELQPESGSIVESMLAVSEECRHDIYRDDRNRADARGGL